MTVINEQSQTNGAAEGPMVINLQHRRVQGGWQSSEV